MQDRDKRSSGLFSVLKWFSSNNAAVEDEARCESSSCDSIESASSFSFIPPGAYKARGAALYLAPAPDTATYRARLAQREARRHTDRDVTLRTKYHLYKPPDTHSLPLMSTQPQEAGGMHRRTWSESSCERHVKVKRRAPPPPGAASRPEGKSSLRRKKRMAPQPPRQDVLCNDSLKLDHGVLKPAKPQPTNTQTKTQQVQQVVQVSPRPWYKRTLSKSSTGDKKCEEKRKSGLSFLTNISELDREAMEILGRENLKLKYLSQAPAFMRGGGGGGQHVRANSDSWISPKRKSARDLIAKFNAITGGRAPTHSEDKETKQQQKQEVIIPVTMSPSTSQTEKKESVQMSKTTAVVKPISRSQWNCPKCTLENDYWRIICRVCSTIKPYFDDFTSVSTALAPFTQHHVNTDQPTHTKDTTDLFGLGSVECRISDLQRSVLQSHYPKLSQNINRTSDNIGNCQTEDMKTFENTKDTTLPSVDTENKLSTNEPNKNENNSGIFVQSQYPKLNLNLNNENMLAIAKFSEKNSTENNKQIDINSEKISKQDNNINTKLQKEDLKKIQKIILGDELGFTKPKVATESEQTSTGNTKVEKMILGDEISVEKPDYVNVNKYEHVETGQNKLLKIEKMILGDEISVTKSPKTITNSKCENIEDKETTAKREERDKLKKMLIEMKNSLPKRVHKNNENKHRVSLIQEQSEPEPEPEQAQEQEPLQEEEQEGEEKEQTAEIIVATTETLYENIKVKHSNVEKPVKVSSGVQTNAVLRRNVSSELTEPKAAFHLIGAKDFVGISNEKTAHGEAEGHTYANLDVTGAKSDVFAGCSKTDTLEINRLLRRLETAIGGGELGAAAVFARELAQLKVPLSVIRQRSQAADKHNDDKHAINVDMYVEDKMSHRGPFPLRVQQTMTVAELKAAVEDKYKIPVGVQRWILGKQLATDDTATLAAHQVTTGGCPVFLYLVAPNTEINPVVEGVEIVEVNDVEAVSKPVVRGAVYHIPIAIIEEASDEVEEAEDEEETDEDEDQHEHQPVGCEDDVQELWKCGACTLLNPVASDKCEVCGLRRGPTEQDTCTAADTHTYQQLVSLDNEELVRNASAFECLVCLAECPPGDGVTLRECLHQFCRACLAQLVEVSADAEVLCPYRDAQYACDLPLQDREVKALVSAAVYELHLAKSVQQAEHRMDNTFHCKTPDCTGWCIYEDNVNHFRCPVCTNTNCLTCQAIHVGVNCLEYQEQMQRASDTDGEARRTRDFLADMTARGEALACPTCRVLLLKKWGCDWLRCSMCRTEICWVTRGPRWGPGGKGDTTAGCKCGINGVKCHPKCNYCH